MRAPSVPHQTWILDISASPCLHHWIGGFVRRIFHESCMRTGVIPYIAGGHTIEKQRVRCIGLELKRVLELRICLLNSAFFLC
jgi:hypothetical protein